MKTQQITKTFKGNSAVGATSEFFSANGKLNSNQGILAREPSLAKVEEAVCWQNKMKEAHADDLLDRSAIVLKQSTPQISTKKSLYEKAMPNHYFSAS